MTKHMEIKWIVVTVLMALIMTSFTLVKAAPPAAAQQIVSTDRQVQRDDKPLSAKVERSVDKIAAKGSKRCRSKPIETYVDAPFPSLNYHSFRWGKCQAMRWWDNGYLDSGQQFATFACSVFLAAGWAGVIGGIVCAGYMLARFQGFKNAFAYAIQHEYRCPQARIYKLPGGPVALYKDPSHVTNCYYP